MSSAVLLAGALCCAPGFAQPAAAGMRVVGEGSLDWFGLRIYEARLLAPAGFEPVAWERHPFALELTYRRSLRGRDIARRSIEEMARSPQFTESKAAGWEAQLAALLPNVKPGDRITGDYQPSGAVRFSFNDRVVGTIEDPLFAVLFFGIWLAPHTSQPALRAALLGSAAR